MTQPLLFTSASVERIREQMRLTTAVIIAALTGLVVSIVITLGHTLTVIQTRQQHEDEAIKCILDQRCLQQIRARQVRGRAPTPRIAA